MQEYTIPGSSTSISTTVCYPRRLCLRTRYVNMKCIIPTYGCFARGYKTDRYGRWKDTLEGLDVRGCFSTLDDLEKALDYIDCGETASTSLE